MSCRAAASMFSRLATFWLLPLTRASMTRRDVAFGQIANQRACGRQRAVVRVTNAEDQLDDRIILLGKGAQVLIEARLGAVKGLHHRDGRPLSRGRQRVPGETDSSNRRADEICPSRCEDDRDDECQGHQTRPRRLLFQILADVRVKVDTVDGFPIRSRVRSGVNCGGDALAQYS